MVALATNVRMERPSRSCLVAMQATGNAALGGAIDVGLALPRSAEGFARLIVLADGDEAGEAAVRDCTLRGKRKGRRVSMEQRKRTCQTGLQDGPISASFSWKGRPMNWPPESSARLTGGAYD
jgi:hypothetical protein